MNIDTSELRPYLYEFDFEGLFVEGLGWNYYDVQPNIVQIDDHAYSLNPVAEKAGFVVFQCKSMFSNDVPKYPIRRKIESQVAKIAFEHIVIFVDGDRKEQVWQWVRREPGKPPVCREHPYYAGQNGNPLLQRLQAIAVTLDEEPAINISAVALRVRAALDVEKVTKRFYDQFRKELTTFEKFIDGINGQTDRDWYASLTLNRLMFVYFIQKQGFLDGDIDYLPNRLRLVRENSGAGRFQEFYRVFLLRLFHEGLGQPEATRTAELHNLLGKIPFLNGGLFDVHALETDNPNISIPDEAFERIFCFFDSYRWHLDERPKRRDDEINPDVLGYIFEKYVNQKQMGAYYTKEDITSYISRNTIIPFLFDAAKKKCPVAFEPRGGVWRLLSDDPDRYIYPAVGHGITWNAGDAVDPDRLKKPNELPAEITAGIGSVSQRGDWNQSAPDDYALPTETWREVVARRQRHQEINAKLKSGEVQEINDLITFNLDIEQFTKDVIAQSEGSELLRAFWQAIRDVSILDPTCGSGAFLFAALNILEPLYTACLEGMRGFLDDLDRTDRPHHPDSLSDFRDVLHQVATHPNERYFILKSIVLNNLYGVDIMDEAVEICKLRLFLKLVAQLKNPDQIEPLPDIDFNVRSGNTLVGFTSLNDVRRAMTITSEGQHRQVFPEEQDALKRIENEADAANSAFNEFRWRQTMFDGDVVASDKTNLRQQFDNLSTELDQYLAADYQIDARHSKTFDAWRASHQPFHWFVEFYGTMSKGGFDVVIGNPPFVEYSKIKGDYTVRGYRTEACGNLYAFVIERNKELCTTAGRTSMIVPHSAICTDRMAEVQTVLFNDNLTWVSSYDIRPSKLFDGVDQRLCIYIALTANGRQASFSSRYHRWASDKRPTLFQDLEYVDSTSLGFVNSVPKLQSLLETSTLEKLMGFTSLEPSLRNGRGPSIYFHNAPRYWVRAMDYAPYFWNERDGEKISNQVKILKPATEEDAAAVVAGLNSSLFYWWFLLLSDCRHLNLREIESFPLGLERMRKETKQRLARLTDELMGSFKRHCQRKESRYQSTGKVIYDEFDQKPSKSIVDKIDGILAEHYGFTDDELDFIINYDIKFRMGRGK